MFESFLPKRVKQEDLEVTGVSRSGRVRKKSSKLTDFESPDEIDNRYKRRSDGKLEAPVGGAMRGRKPTLGDVSSAQQMKMESRSDASDSEEMTEMFVSKIEPPDSESDSEMSIYPPPDEGDDSSMDSLEGSDEEEEEMDDDNLMDDRSNSNQRRDTPENAISSQAQSLYMMEKSTKKKLIVRDGKIVGRMKAQRKDKGKTRYTAYMLWAKEVRLELLRANPDMDFATMSKRLGELWATVPNNEKYNWKRRAKRLAAKGGGREAPNNTESRWKAPPSRSKFINKLGGRAAATNSISNENTNFVSQKQQSDLQAGSPTVGNAATSPDAKPAKAGLITEPVVGPGLYKVVGTQPVDVAAHLKLLGESLSIIGERLKEHEGQIAVSGSLSVLLDSLLCALGPLLCLTQQMPETNGCSPDMLSKILDNIAYFMPGL